MKSGKISIGWPVLAAVFGFAVAGLHAQGNSVSKDKAAESRLQADKAWNRLVASLSAPRSAKGDDADAAAVAVSIARLANDFYRYFPQHEKAQEARKWEVLCLIDAAAFGDTSASAEIKGLVADYRTDKKAASFDRAVVAGTYEFSEASKRIKTLADVPVEFEGVARSLIAEFPDQPQGYVSLLTQAAQRPQPAARSMAMEVVNAASVPEDVRSQAKTLVRRLDLVGQSADAVCADASQWAVIKRAWKKGQPGLVYFWATWSPESLGLGEKLAQLAKASWNVAGICVDTDLANAIKVAGIHKLPGTLVYPPKGMAGELPTRLAADAAPLLYLVDAQGNFLDVRGLDEFEAKLGVLDN